MLRPTAKAPPAGTLVQGALDSSPRTAARLRARLTRLRPVMLLAAGFLLSSLSTFAVAHLLGSALRVEAVAADLRVAVAGVLCLVLCGVDLAVLGGRRTWPIGPSRQTPKAYLLRTGRWAALLWGLDTGLAVTTFRVVTLTWAALGFSVLHLVPWWAGLAYGVGFAGPLAVAILGPRLRAPSTDGVDQEPLWLPRLLAAGRPPVRVGAVLLLLGAVAAAVAALPA